MAELSEEQVRIRGYLQAQAAKLTVAELIEKVRSDSAALRISAEAATKVDCTARPRPDEWSVNDVLAHLAETCTRVNADILAAWREGKAASALRDALQRTSVVRQPGEWWEAIASEREALFAELATARGDEHLEVKWRHPFFGDLNWREWVLFLRLHDGDHARQIEQIVGALG
jgi:hypothetical protein